MTSMDAVKLLAGLSATSSVKGLGMARGVLVPGRCHVVSLSSRVLPSAYFGYLA